MSSAAVVIGTLRVEASKMKMEFANREDPHEMAYNEPPHLELNCLLFSL